MTLLDVIEAMEGKIALNRCLLEGDFCHRTDWCQVHLTWIEAQQAMRSILTRKSLKQIAEESTARRLAGSRTHDPAAARTPQSISA
jgi:DNA-binding IscR family transcriptional regulator